MQAAGGRWQEAGGRNNGHRIGRRWQVPKPLLQKALFLVRVSGRLKIAQHFSAGNRE